MFMGAAFASYSMSWPTSPFLSPKAVSGKLSLDTLLQMSGSQVRATMRKLGSSSEECSRLTAALSCLKSAAETGLCWGAGSLPGYDLCLSQFLQEM